MKTLPSTIKFHQTIDARQQSAAPLEHLEYAKQQIARLSSDNSQDKVTISDEAKARFAQDLASVDTSAQRPSSTDKIIETIKEQIELLMKRLNRIKYDKSEQAKQERKQLQHQINALNAVLLDFLGKKLNAI